MEEDQKKLAEYYITRIRSLGNSTSKVGFTFLVGLTLIWFFSIQPNYKKVKDYAFKKVNYDSLKRTSVDSKYDSLRSIISSNSAFVALSDSINKMAVKDEEDLKQRQAEAKHVADTVRKETRIKFDLIGYKIETPFTDGIVLWMIILLVVIIYILLNRLRILTLISRTVRIFYKELNIPKYVYTDYDLQVPFWVSPLPLRGYKVVEGDKEIKVDKSDLLELLNWKKEEASSRIIAYILSIVVLLLQFSSCFLIWKASGIFYDNEITIYLFIGCANLLLFATAYLIFIWFKPLTIPAAYPAQQRHNLISRKEFITFISVPIVSTGIYYLFGKWSFLKSKEEKRTNYVRREKKEEKFTKTLGKFEGFYLSENNANRTLHYFHSRGKSSSLRTIASSRVEKFATKLKPITIENVLKDQRLYVQIPSIAAEAEAIKLIKQNKIDSCFDLLLKAIRSRVAFGSVRLLDLTAGLFMIHNSENFTSYKEDYMKFLASNEELFKSWQINSIRLSKWRLEKEININNKIKKNKWALSKPIKWNNNELNPGISM